LLHSLDEMGQGFDLVINRNDDGKGNAGDVGDVAIAYEGNREGLLSNCC
jgi:hypothetical protein